MQLLRRLFIGGYITIVLLFVACAMALIVFAIGQIWRGVGPGSTVALTSRFNAILEGIGLLTIAVAALELGQTILEEEVQRESHMSAPTRVRRFMSRFLVVIVVALGIETLVTAFQLVHDNPAHLPAAASIGYAAAAILIAWGVFIHLNKGAEELEPEAMQQAKAEDQKVEDGNT
ncbi:MAG: hypothetical protein ABR606_19400 [Vicinamibacterales bacterium]